MKYDELSDAWMDDDTFDAFIRAQTTRIHAKLDGVDRRLWPERLNTEDTPVMPAHVYLEWAEGEPVAVSRDMSRFGVEVRK